MSTTPSMSPDDLFTMLIFNFQQNAMISLGKLQNPATGKAQRNLPDAKFSIDMLEMLSEKTQGNRTPEQDTLFTQILTSLRLNYVDEQKKPDPEPEEDQTEVPEPDSTAEDSGDTASSNDAEPSGEESEPTA